MRHAAATHTNSRALMSLALQYVLQNKTSDIMDLERTAGSLHHDHHHGIHYHHHHFHFGSRVDVGALATTDCSRPIDCDTGTRRAVLPFFLGVLITLIGFNYSGHGRLLREAS